MPCSKCCSKRHLLCIAAYMSDNSKDVSLLTMQPNEKSKKKAVGEKSKEGKGSYFRHRIGISHEKNNKNQIIRCLQSHFPLKLKHSRVHTKLQNI